MWIFKLGTVRKITVQSWKHLKKKKKDREEFWISRAEYDEHGENILKTK